MQNSVRLWLGDGVEWWLKDFLSTGWECQEYFFDFVVTELQVPGDFLSDFALTTIDAPTTSLRRILPIPMRRLTIRATLPCESDQKHVTLGKVRAGARGGFFRIGPIALFRRPVPLRRAVAGV